MQIFLCNKNTLLQRGSVYTKKSKQLVGLAGWLVDWLRSKQTDSYILLHTALKHWPAFWGEGWVGTLILSYISRFSPFLKVQNFELHFLEGGGGRDGQINKCVWEYDENYDFFTFCESFLSIWRFFMVKVQIWRIFLGLLNFKYFSRMCLIFLIFLGIKSRCWVQAYVFEKIKLTPMGSGTFNTWTTR